MEITSFELHAQTPIPGWDFPFRISIRGTGLEPRAVPFDATFGTNAAFGTNAVWALRPAMDGGGLMGFLIELPAIDDELMFGFLGEPLVGTGLDGRIPG
jgi:hypothetical protein